jgi:uncharacterized membrane-anchored protein YhcB (DUF1043 family)
MNDQKPSFLKNHADTVAIIGVNLGIAAILVAILLSNISSIQAVNARMDASNSRLDASQARLDTMYTMFYDLLKEQRK